jgi:hypothetical protein
MFLSTKSCGVRRLSLILGIVAAGYFVVVRHPITNWQGPTQSTQYLIYNVVDMAVGGVASFAIAWATVRILAWIVAGFLDDYSKFSK